MKECATACMMQPVKAERCANVMEKKASIPNVYVPSIPTTFCTTLHYTTALPSANAERTATRTRVCDFPNDHRSGSLDLIE